MCFMMLCMCVSINTLSCDSPCTVFTWPTNIVLEYLWVCGILWSVEVTQGMRGVSFKYILLVFVCEKWNYAVMRSRNITGIFFYRFLKILYQIYQVENIQEPWLTFPGSHLKLGKFCLLHIASVQSTL